MHYFLGENTMNIGYAAGAFDLFHVGHLNILREAKKNCDYLIAGVVSDEMLELTKGRKPIVPLAERMEIVSHIDFVDEVRAETVVDKLETWEQVKFNTFFKGDDWKGTPPRPRPRKALCRGGCAGRLLPLHRPYLLH